MQLLRATPFTLHGAPCGDESLHLRLTKDGEEGCWTSGSIPSKNVLVGQECIYPVAIWPVVSSGDLSPHADSHRTLWMVMQPGSVKMFEWDKEPVLFTIIPPRASDRDPSLMNEENTEICVRDSAGNMLLINTRLHTSMDIDEETVEAWAAESESVQQHIYRMGPRLPEEVEERGWRRMEDCRRDVLTSELLLEHARKHFPNFRNHPDNALLKVMARTCECTVSRASEQWREVFLQDHLIREWNLHSHVNAVCYDPEANRLWMELWGEEKWNAFVRSSMLPFHSLPPYDDLF